jgi:redox-sensitive bicupin YhaK (pirin superfamily)
MNTPFDQIIEPREISFDGFPVARSLPRIGLRSVGPWVFFDHMGPYDFPAGGGMDVLPHPHINLATVTYLFDGGIMHRDSLGNARLISPGAINLMNAGRGIAHSERSPDDLRSAGHRVHGLQLWHALPMGSEDAQPTFHHYPADAIPRIRTHGLEIRVLMGAAYGHASPVKDLAGARYLEYRWDGPVTTVVPDFPGERALYSVEGSVTVNGSPLQPRRLALLKPGSVVLAAGEPGRLVLIGGEPMGKRYMWWNFVSSSKSRIERAMAEWKSDAFAPVAGDPGPRVPLPESDNYSFMKD